MYAQPLRVVQHNRYVLWQRSFFAVAANVKYSAQL
jgi:hypothetical protein